jgi:hypothetical protein
MEQLCGGVVVLKSGIQVSSAHACLVFILVDGQQRRYEDRIGRSRLLVIEVKTLLNEDRDEASLPSSRS